MSALVGLGGVVPALSNNNNPQQQQQGMSLSQQSATLNQQQPTAHNNPSNNNNALPAHLMGLMTNPAMAAAAAASPLFPPAALLSSPGAYLSMPEAFAAGVFQARQQQTLQQQGGLHDVSSTQGMMAANMSMAQSQQQQQQQMAAPTASTNNPLVMDVGSSLNAFLGMAPLSSPSMTLPHPSTTSVPSSGDDKKAARKANHDLSVADRQKQNRDRNREHARSTRLRKKAYVAKLKELVEGLHAERTEEVRQRRIAIQSLAEMQNVRRSVVKTFLKYHANYEPDERKWSTLLEDKFWLKQPVTPYRSFRSSEIEKVRNTMQHEAAA